MKQFLNWVKSFLPRKLPIGKTSFEAWITDVIALSKLPDNSSTRRVAGMFILRLPPALAYLSIRKISNQLIKAAANQVASEVIVEAEEYAKAEFERSKSQMV